MQNKIIKILQYLGLRKKEPITDIENLLKFIHSSCSFVSQVSLITYIKARAGTQYPKLFENSEYLESIDIARSNIYGSSVVDFIYYIFKEYFNEILNQQNLILLSQSLLKDVFILADKEEIKLKNLKKIQKKSIEELNELFLKAADHKIFNMSSNAFVKWAPMIEDYKKEDEEIMRNSIHFRWIEIRREVRSRIQAKNLILKFHY